MNKYQKQIKERIAQSRQLAKNSSGGLKGNVERARMMDSGESESKGKEKEV